MPQNKKAASTQSGKRKGPKPNLEVDQAAARKLGLLIPKSLPLSRMLSPNDAAKLLGLTGPGIKRWIHTGKLHATKKSNGYWLIKASDLEETIQRRQSDPRPRVLVYAPEPSTREQLARVMKTQDCESIVTQHVADALLKARNRRPNALVIALDSGGWTLLQRFRSDSHIRSAGILLFSDRDLTEDESDRALGLKVQGFMRLPANDQTIAVRLQELSKVGL